MRKRFFSLIEILVVVALIAVLAAMLMPAAAKGMAKAHEVICCSNLRQLDLAFQLYAADNRQRFPPYVANNKYMHGGTNWARYTFQYYSDSKILDCPTSPQGAPEETKEALHLYDGNYGWNYDGLQGNHGPIQAIARLPAATYNLFDSGDPCVIYGANNWTNLMEELDLDWDSGPEGPNRHNNQVNVVFMDGHASSRKLVEFISAPNKSKSAPWYIDWEGGCLIPGLIPYPER